MTRTIMLVPATVNAGSSVVAYGLLDALLERSVRAAIFPPIDLANVEEFLAHNRLDDLLDEVIGQYEAAATDKDVVIIHGVSLINPYASELNFAIATALHAAVIFVVAPQNDLQLTMRHLSVTANPYLHRYEQQILGYCVNKIDSIEKQLVEKYSSFFNINFPLLGLIPYRNELTENTGTYHRGVAGAVISKYFDLNWLWPFLNSSLEPRMTPPKFRHNLIATARAANKKIVLPEGDEPRTLQAANICTEQGIAKCILLGRKEIILAAAAKINLKLHDKIIIMDPDGVREQYVAPLCELRKSKGLTAEAAREQLQDNVVLGTMMLQLGEVDGLVSGAVHTTANTIRPALQIIKTAPDSKLVSSVFFMCLPDQVLIYGDCAINPNPTAEELADIAIQSADSAAAFGITPRVAMLSYSTGTSGAGHDVDLVKAATETAKTKRPDLEIDGPLQYDAAIDKEVARLKAPNSRVAGRATVFIMPSLDVGNIAYKTVQRGAKVVCIGPMLQGLRKPVNDLSRGCLVEDIVFTIAVTAVQATGN